MCNRGTNAVQDGVSVAFLETMTMDQDVSMATVVCEAATTMLLQIGQCEVVKCVATLAGTGNVFVDVDPDDTIADCHPGNNLGADAFTLPGLTRRRGHDGRARHRRGDPAPRVSCTAAPRDATTRRRR
ncbi:hypothetical protein [Nannocystis pusilla]|uniref:hypothetical protein n=1 Tax=Nannocystis pusilla TaxID=889268 RepID=UPI003B7B7609